MKKKNRIAFFNILSTILLRGISLFSSPIFSRLVGTGGFGVLSVYNIWAGVTSVTFSLQTQGTIVNARVEYSEEEQPAYQSSVMALSLLFFLGCSAVVLLLFINPISRGLSLSKMLIGLLLFQSFGTFCVNFLNSKFTYEFKADQNMYISVGVAVATFGLSLLLVLKLPQEINYYGRIWGNALVYGIVGVVSCFLILRNGKCFYNKKYWTFCLMLAVPVVFQNLSYLILGHSDLVMLRSMNGDSASGIYGYAYNLGDIMFTIFTALNNTWVPFFFEDMKQGNRQEIRSQEKNFLELYTILSMGFVLLATEVFHLYAARSFWDGTKLIPLFVASYYLNFLCTYPVNYEYYHKKTRIVAIVTIVSALLNVALNYVFIMKFGMVGAAVATLLSRVLQFAFHFVYARYLMGKGDYPFATFRWLPYTLFFFAAVALFYMTPNAWIVRWGIGAVIGVWELLQIRKRKSLF